MNINNVIKRLKSKHVMKSYFFTNFQDLGSWVKITDLLCLRLRYITFFLIKRGNLILRNFHFVKGKLEFQSGLE